MSPAECTVLLEASAGTGKTFEIARRTAQALALGRVRIDQLLLVTFARAATEELGERVRTHLHASLTALTTTLGGGTPEPALAPLCAAESQELRRRVARLQAALGAYDEATITTTHTFCSRMLRALGVLADFDPAWTRAESFDEMLLEITDDTYLSRYRTRGRGPFRLDVAEQLARAAAYSGPVETVDEDQEIGGFVRHVHAEFRRRKLRAGLLDYDDLQVLLRDALADPRQGEPARRLLRDRFRLVLVDEFQDTDPVQWQILRAAFHEHVPLVLVGDPKQAIYGFRGADIATYLAARGQVHETTGLTRNWRSDLAVVQGVDRILRGLALGDPQITVEPVQATHEPSRIRGVPAAVRLRSIVRDGLPSAVSDRSGLHPVGPVRARVVQDLVGQVLDLLGPDVTLHTEDGWQRVRPGQIAVLTGTNATAGQVQQALLQAGVPAVLPVSNSVLATPAAADWDLLLRALARPTDQGRIRACALTSFFGWTGDRLAVSEDVDEVGDQLSRWHETLTTRGVGGLFDDACTRTDLTARVLGVADGERRLTDLRHICELLQAQERDGTCGASALSSWLRAQMETAEQRGSRLPTPTSRRLESDAAAVKVMTVHAAKGLEFPIVLLPFVADHAPRNHDGDSPLTLQDGHTRLIAAQPDADIDARQRQEAAGENLRLLYVALTRAASHVVVWWSANTQAPRSGLHRVLFADRGAGPGPAISVPVPEDHRAAATLDRLAAGSGGTIVHEPVPRQQPASPVRPPAQPPEPAELVARSFARPLDLRWRRTSYTALTAELHELPSAPGASEPESVGIQDEPDEDGEPQPSPAGPVGGAVSPLAELPGGTNFGTLVHEILEVFEPGQPDPSTQLAELTRGAARVAALTPTQTQLLADGLTAVVHTPLGPLAPGHSLATVTDRLVELDFELPLAGGDHPADSRTVGELADLLAAELPAEDPLAGYPAQLRVPELAGKALRGYLTGSLDAVLRVRDEQGGPRFLVVDYKTNRLAGPEEVLRLGHYRPGPMTEAMIRAHYPLQALLYQVALHRYLRWRQPGYHPEQHLGGVLYLFVRGMGGPDTPHGTGVFSWRPPAALVVQASRLLAGQR